MENLSLGKLKQCHFGHVTCATMEVEGLPLGRQSLGKLKQSLLGKIYLVPMWKWKDCHWENGKTSTGKMETVLPGICDKCHCGKSLEMEGLPVRNGKSVDLETTN